MQARPTKIIAKDTVGHDDGPVFTDDTVVVTDDGGFMPALKNVAISLLGSVSAQGLATTVTGTIFTVPPGKVARVTHVTVFRPTGSLAAASAVNFGSFFNNSANQSLATLTATTNCITFQGSAVGNVATAGQAFQVFVASGAAASAQFNAFGFLDTA